MYIYPDSPRSKATLWIWQLRDTGIIGVCALIPTLALTQTNSLPPIVVTAVYAFLIAHFEDASITNFIRYACGLFSIRQQLFEWRYGA